MDLNQTAASLEYNLNVFPTCHETLKQFSQDKLYCVAAFNIALTSIVFITYLTIKRCVSACKKLLYKPYNVVLAAMLECRLIVFGDFVD